MSGEFGLSLNLEIDALNGLLTQATTDSGRLDLDVRKDQELFAINLDQVLTPATQTVVWVQKLVSSW